MNSIQRLRMKFGKQRTWKKLTKRKSEKYIENINFNLIE